MACSGDATTRFSLPQLQNFIKRDPATYFDEYLLRKRQLSNAIAELKQLPAAPAQHLLELTMFAAHVAPLYREEHWLAQELVQLLATYGKVTRPITLKTLLSAILLLNRERCFDSKLHVPQLLALIKDDGFVMKKLVLQNVVQILARAKAEDKRYWMRYLVGAAAANPSESPGEAVFILAELYLKADWSEPVAMNGIANAFFCCDPKIAKLVAHFLLGNVDTLKAKLNKLFESDAADSAEKQQMINDIAKELETRRKKSKGMRRLQRMKQAVTKVVEKSESAARVLDALKYKVLDALYNPQQFAEQALKLASDKKLPYKLRLMALTVIARLMSRKNVWLENFYLRVLPYLYKGSNVLSQVLLIVVESVTTETPLDALHVVVDKIISEFVHESQDEAVLLKVYNALRLLSSRNCYALTEPNLEFLLDVSKQSKQSALQNAGRTLRNQFVVARPSALPKRFRGSAKASVAFNDCATRAGAGSDLEAIEILAQLKTRYFQKLKKSYALNSQDFIASHLISDKELQLLKRIKLKYDAALQAGYSLKQWLDQDPAHWAELSRELLDSSSSPSARTVEARSSAAPRQASGRGSDSETTSGAENAVELDAELDLDECDSSDSSDLSDIDALDIACSKESNAAPRSAEAAPQLVEVEDEPSGEASGSASDYIGSLASLSDASEDEAGEGFIEESMLGRERKRSKEVQLYALRAERAESRRLHKAKRSGGKPNNRAGLTNRSLQRNKPMQMLRQKLSVREKSMRSVKNKVASLKKQVKLAKLNKRQKYRRV